MTEADRETTVREDQISVGPGGRLTIPSNARNRLRIAPNQYVEVTVVADREYTFTARVQSQFRLTIPENIREGAGIEQKDRIDIEISRYEISR